MFLCNAFWLCVIFSALRRRPPFRGSSQLEASQHICIINNYLRYSTLCTPHHHTRSQHTHTQTHTHTHTHTQTHTNTQHVRVRAAAEKYPDPGTAAAPRRAHHQSLRGAAAGLCWAQLLCVANATVPGIHAGLLLVLIIGMFI